MFLGIVFVILGISLMIYPFESYVTISLVFGVSILIAGILEIWHAISVPKENESSMPFFLGGLISVYVGVLFVLNTELTMLFLPYYFGFWLLFRATLFFGKAYDLKSSNLPNWTAFLGLGIATLLLSVLILINPVYGSLHIVILTALTFIALGVFNFMLSHTIKKTVIMLKNKEAN